MQFGNKTMAKAVYILTQEYAGQKNIIAVCDNYTSVKKLAREWFEEEFEELSKNNDLETEFSMPETHDCFFMREEVYCDIVIRSKENNAAKYLFIEAFGVNDFCN